MAWTGAAAILLAFTTTSFAQSTIYVIPVAAPSTTSEQPMPSTPPASSLHSSSTSTCTETICADYINTCGIWYGGCYAACSWFPTPTFTPPPCNLNSTTPTNSYANATSSTYVSTITSAPVYISPWSSNSTCDKVICVDYINTCDIKYGGCYPVCSNSSTPSYTNPGCPSGTFRSSFSKSVIRTTRTNSCGYSCDYKVDDCGNTYGPGCYTSCPGAEVPGYTIPVCEVTSTTTDAAVMTSEAFTTTSRLNEDFITGTEVTPTPVNNPTGEAR